MNISHRKTSVPEPVCPSCGSKSFPDKYENGRNVCSKCGYWNKHK